jgi:cysteine desulfurase
MIYLDCHATTPCDPQVINAMLPYFGELFGNPSSTVHEAGRKADNAIKQARRQVANLIGSMPKEIVFTSGATESNNIAIQGLVRGSNGSRKRIVTTHIEHKSIINQCNVLKENGYEIIYLPVNQTGIVNVNDAEKMINEDTLVVSIQTANNEIGTIQPITDLVEIAHRHGAYFHTDAAQAVGKIPMDVETYGVDLLSISAHKMYGPKGVGALYVWGGAYALPIKPLVQGGGQEYNLRSGTLNVPGIIGLGKASELSLENLEGEMVRIASLRDMLEEELMTKVEVKRNGAIDNRLPGNSNLTFPGIDAEALLINTPDLAISTGSACTSGAPEPSYVLEAVGLSREDAYSSIRIGLGRFTTENEINKTVGIIVGALKKLISRT